MTDTPRGLFVPADYQTLIRKEADRLLAGLAVADEGAPVPTCPSWTVRELVTHLGTTHQWAGRNASSGLDGTSPNHETTGPTDGKDLAEWYAGCVDELLRVLVATDPDTPCWTFQRDYQTAGFWSRRQSHETAMHRNDLEIALDRTPSYDSAYAADALGEIFDVFLSRRSVRGAPPLDVPVPVLIECTDRPERWLLAPAGTDEHQVASEHQEAGEHGATGKHHAGGEDHGAGEQHVAGEHRVAGPTLSPAQVDSAAAALRGSAAGLLFAFWERLDAPAAGLTVTGDAALAERLLASKLTP